MNKRKLSISLVSSVIGLLTVSACSGATTASDKNIVTFKGYDGEEISVVTNSVFNEYRKQSNGISQFYNAILETVIRYQFDSNPTPDKALNNKTLATIKEEAAEQVKNAKSEADENRKTNGTSYETEWQNELDKYGVKDEAQLLEHFIYQIEKQELTDLYFKENKNSLINEYIGVKADGTGASSTVKGVFPYHIRHVLSTVSGGATNFYNGEITKDEAIHLANTMKALIDPNYTFSAVANDFSQDNSSDDSSAKKGGDLGIMSTTTSFVNEFKLGIYAYDAILSGRDENDTILKGLGLQEKFNHFKGGEQVKESAYDYFKDTELVKVPYGAFMLMDKENIIDGVNVGGYADVELDSNHKKVNNGNTHYYPRNILWNLYLNQHAPFVITNEKLVEDSTNHNLVPTVDVDLDTNKFNEDGILTDGDGHIIIGVRSEHGIHFMVIQKSIYEFDTEGGKDSEETSLSEYYTTYVPGDFDANNYTKSYPYYMDGEVRKDKNTYVNFIKTNDQSKYTTRANEVKNAVKSFDANYDYRLFQLYENNDKFVFNNTDGLDLKAIIDEYINSSISNSSFTAYKSLKDSWKSYVELIELQNTNRTFADETKPMKADQPNAFRLIPSRCAVGFTSHSDSAWSKGGICYYED